MKSKYPQIINIVVPPTFMVIGLLLMGDSRGIYVVFGLVCFLYGLFREIQFINKLF